MQCTRPNRVEPENVQKGPARQVPDAQDSDNTYDSEDIITPNHSLPSHVHT